MENPEKDILKNLLQETFSDWEPEPSNQSWHTIQQAIQPAQVGIGTWMKRWFLPSAGLFLLIGSLLVWQTEANHSQLFAKSSNKLSPIESNQKDMLYTSSTKQKEAVSVATVQPKSQESAEIVREVSQRNNPTEKISHQSKVVRNSYLLTKSTKVKSVFDNDSPEALTGLAGSSSTQKSSEFIANNPLIEVQETRSSNNLLEINELSEKKLTYFHNGLELPKLSAIILSKDPKPIRKERIFSLSVTPLQTYRIITVTTNEVLKLQRSSLFNSERNGVAIALGTSQPIQKNLYLRTNLSYLMMKQWAQYQVSTDGVLVNNTKASNTIETILETKVESETLEMFGLKADFQQFIRESGRNRYFLSLGPQVMYDPTNRQANIFINASAGFQHTVNNNYFITIEPVASYSINNINDKNSLLQTNVYNLGLKMGLSFRSR
ncbi:MAG: hypothetical protein ACOVOW_11620 [Spirosomataceae bacterium]